MEDIEFFKADSSHNAELRKFLREDSGSLRLEREPDYFEATQVEGIKVDVFAGRRNREIVALGTRSEKPCYLNGESDPKTTGYISNVKITPGLRSTSVLFRGYRFFIKLHRKSSCRFYLFTVMNDNNKVLNVLQKNSGLSLLSFNIKSIPTVMPLGSYLTHFLSTAKENMYSKSPSDLTVRRACIQDVPVILDFIRNNGRQRQFYPSYTERDITGTGLLKDLTIEDIFLAFEGPRIVGTLTAWDQTGFRQWYLNDQEAVLDPCSNLHP